MGKQEGYSWSKWIVLIILGLILFGSIWQDYGASQVIWQTHRFSMAVSGDDGMVTFVSFDPVEKRVLALPFPQDLSIKSRSVGEYNIGSLYKIGEYDGEGAAFVRRKVQGFMRVPIPGYLTLPKQGTDLRQSLSRGLLLSTLSFKRRPTNLSRLDSFALWYRLSRFTWKQAEEAELARAGVLEKREGGGYLYVSDRLQQYVGTRLFDWGVGASGVTIAVVNFSGIDGMGSDMADFINNLGLDVISVRTGNEVREDSKVVTGDLKKYRETTKILQTLLGLPDPQIGDTESYRSQVVVEVGSDASELF